MSVREAAQRAGAARSDAPAKGTDRDLERDTEQLRHLATRPTGRVQVERRASRGDEAARNALAQLAQQAADRTDQQAG